MDARIERAADEPAHRGDAAAEAKNAAVPGLPTPHAAIIIAAARSRDRAPAGLRPASAGNIDAPRQQRGGRAVSRGRQAVAGVSVGA